MNSKCNGGVGVTSLNNRRVPPTSSASGRTPVSRLTLSRQNSLRAQSTVVGARLALRRVSLHMTTSRSASSHGSVAGGSFGKAPDVTAGVTSVKTESEATGSPRDEVDDDDDEV